MQQKRFVLEGPFFFFRFGCVFCVCVFCFIVFPMEGPEIVKTRRSLDPIDCITFCSFFTCSDIQ